MSRLLFIHLAVLALVAAWAAANPLPPASNGAKQIHASPPPPPIIHDPPVLGPPRDSYIEGEYIVTIRKLPSGIQSPANTNDVHAMARSILDTLPLGPPTDLPMAPRPVLDAWYIPALIGGSSSSSTSPGFVAFAAKMSEIDAKQIAAHPLVERVDANTLFYPTAIQNNPPNWGLSRISSRTLTTTGPFRYPDEAGAGTRIYIVDTGIDTAHPDFGGRAIWGAVTCPGCAPADGNSHGTHVAGIAGGTSVGVAKMATLVAVKVLTDAGPGPLAGIIAGLNWVVTDCAGRKCVINMSLGGGFNQAFNDAVEAVIAAGITVVVAAGNENVDACTISPASAPDAITVAASTETDARASFSDFGTCVDLFAPGTRILSDIPGGITGLKSGTSMASPFVAGAAALILSDSPTNLSPAEVTNIIKGRATPDIITDPGAGTPNLLLFVDEGPIFTSTTASSTATYGSSTTTYGSSITTTYGSSTTTSSAEPTSTSYSTGAPEPTGTTYSSSAPASSSYGTATNIPGYYSTKTSIIIIPTPTPPPAL